MRLIDPTKTVIKTARTEHGWVKTREHFNGSQDATVKVKALRLNMTAGAPPNQALVAAVHELEQAQQEWLLAKSSLDERWRTYSAARLRAANERVKETQ
jgi:hypothetical protein